MLIDPIEVPSKALLPIVATESGKLNDENPLHPQNALSSIVRHFETLSNVIVVILQLRNADPPMTSTLLLMNTSCPDVWFPV